MTMDVEANIRNWRSALGARETLRAENLDELEDHLRQEIDELRALQRGDKRALSDAEAFAIAEQRLGSATQLATEFAKADPNVASRRRWIWMLAGYVGLSFASTFISTLAGAVSSRAGASLDPTLRGGVYALVTCAGLAAVVLLAHVAATGRARLLSHGPLARGLRTTTGIVVFTLLVLAVRALFMPLYARYFSLSGNELYASETIHLVLYASFAMWLAPTLALAIVLWLDRSRRSGASDSLSESS